MSKYTPLILDKFLRWTFKGKHYLMGYKILWDVVLEMNIERYKTFTDHLPQSLKIKGLMLQRRKIRWSSSFFVGDNKNWNVLSCVFSEVLSDILIIGSVNEW